MFNNDRYITKGIQQEMPVELQLFMWNCIDQLRDQGQELDYLQVFELTTGRSSDMFFQKIEHRQEVPEYSMTYKVFPAKIIDKKVFVIDDGCHSTMMFAEEY